MDAPQPTKRNTSSTLRRRPANMASRKTGRGTLLSLQVTQDKPEAGSDGSAWEGTSALGCSPGVSTRGPLPGPAAGPPCPPQGAAGRAGAAWCISQGRNARPPACPGRARGGPTPPRGGTPGACPPRGQTEWTGQRCPLRSPVERPCPRVSPAPRTAWWGPQRSEAPSPTQQPNPRLEATPASPWTPGPVRPGGAASCRGSGCPWDPGGS